MSLESTNTDFKNVATRQQVGYRLMCKRTLGSLLHTLVTYLAFVNYFSVHKHVPHKSRQLRWILSAMQIKKTDITLVQSNVSTLS